MKDTDVFIIAGSRFSVHVDETNGITHILDLYYLDTDCSKPIVTQGNVKRIKEFLTTISEFPYHIFVYDIDNCVKEFVEGTLGHMHVHNFRNEIYRPFIWDMQGLSRDYSPNPLSYTNVYNENIRYLDFKGYSLNYEVSESTGVVHVLDITRFYNRPTLPIEDTSVCHELWFAIKELYENLAHVYIYTRTNTICDVFFDENERPIRRVFSMENPDAKTSKDFVLDASYLTHKCIPPQILSALYPLSEGEISEIAD